MKFAASIEYQGSDFHGWQVQKGNLRTVQKVLSEAISEIAQHNVRIFCAGRTDAGVHAKGQVIHFESETKRSNKEWLFGINRYLPADVNVHWISSVDDGFHARFSAIARAYQYRIVLSPVRSSLRREFALFEPRQIDIQNFERALQCFVGEHDFNAFRSSICQAKSSIKTIHEMTLKTAQDEVLIHIKANAFLHNMVRNIIGSTLLIARGARDVSWLQEVIAKKDRKLAGPCAPPQGLYFMRAFYPTHFNLPTNLDLSKQNTLK